VTDTYRISIDDKSDAILRGRVHVVNPDAERVPPGEDFALRLIIEVWHRIREGYVFESVSNRMPDDRLHRDPRELRRMANDPELTAEFERLMGLDQGTDIHLSDEEVAEIRAVHEIRDHRQKESARQALMERYGVESLSIGISAGKPYISTERDSDAFYERAREIVTDYRLGEMRNWPPPWGEDEDEFDEDEYADKLARMTLEDYPYAEFTLTAKDARYLAHMGGGIHLSTAIYGERW
jgi:hypothetical protein